MPSDTDRSSTQWPDSGSEVPLQAVSRLIFASQSQLQAPVLEEMRRIRDHAVHRNAPTLGMAHAVLPDHAAVVRLLEADAAHNRRLIERGSAPAGWSSTCR